MRAHRPLTSNSRRRAGVGFTLVELMVALAIGLVVMLSLVALFLNVSRGNTEMSRTNSLIENGRFATQFLSNDLAHAGYWGGYIPAFDDLTTSDTPTGSPALMPGTPRAVPDACKDYADWTAQDKTNLLGITVQSTDTIAGDCTALVTNQQPNTDILIVRHADTCVPGETNCESDTAGDVYFQASRCSIEWSYVAPSPPDPLNPYTYRFVLDDAGFGLKARGCAGTPPSTTGTAAEKRKFISNLYYIRNYAVTAGDGIPTLVRSTFGLDDGTVAHQPAVPLIDGIEGFRVELGIDNKSDSGADVDYSTVVNWADPNNKVSPTNRGDGIPDEYVRCTAAAPCSAITLTNVVTVKLHLLARARSATPGHTDSRTYNLGPTTLGPFNDSFKRFAYSTTVRLVNVSSRRETP